MGEDLTWYLRQKETVLSNTETEELIKKCSAITLEEEEEDRVIFGGSMKEKCAQIAVDCLVGKILTTRGVSHEEIRVALQQAWRPVGVVKVESL